MVSDWKNTGGGLAGFIHGPHGGWRREYFGDDAAERLRRALMAPEPVIIHQDQREITAKVIIDGAASGILLFPVIKTTFA